MPCSYAVDGVIDEVAFAGMWKREQGTKPDDKVIHPKHDQHYQRGQV